MLFGNMISQRATLLQKITAPDSTLWASSLKSCHQLAAWTHGIKEAHYPCHARWLPRHLISPAASAILSPGVPSLPFVWSACVCLYHHTSSVCAGEHVSCPRPVLLLNADLLMLMSSCITHLPCSIGWLTLWNSTNEEFPAVPGMHLMASRPVLDLSLFNISLIERPFHYPVGTGMC